MSPGRNQPMAAQAPVEAALNVSARTAFCDAAKIPDAGNAADCCDDRCGADRPDRPQREAITDTFEADRLAEVLAAVDPALAEK
jgi:hypothetical protein